MRTYFPLSLRTLTERHKAAHNRKMKENTAGSTSSLAGKRWWWPLSQNSSSDLSTVHVGCDCSLYAHQLYTLCADSTAYLFAYAQMLSISGRFFKAASTFPRETYSPACSFTRSFLRSAQNKGRNNEITFKHI